jgi:hypothetical protein
MGGGIFLIQGDEQLVEMTEKRYDSEDLLQTLLAKYPSVLAGDQVDGGPRRWLLISRETALPSEEDGSGRWSVDHLFIDSEAVPTLVEVKRSSDTRIRREVVGQMLDYAANAVVYWQVERLRANFESTCEAEGSDPDALVRELVDETGEPEQFWEQVGTNLQAGKIRLVFVADEIPAELQRIVEFLNTQMSPAEVIAIEVRQYVGKGLRTLVPRVLGQTAEAQTRKGRSIRKRWDEETFIEDLREHCTEGEVRVAERLIDWAREKLPEFSWGTGARASLIPALKRGGFTYRPIVLYVSGPTIELRFLYLIDFPPFDQTEKRRAFLEHLNRVPALDLPDDTINRVARIVPLALFEPEDAFQALTVALDWFVSQIPEEESSPVTPNATATPTA